MHRDCLQEEMHVYLPGNKHEPEGGRPRRRMFVGRLREGDARSNRKLL